MTVIIIATITLLKMITSSETVGRLDTSHLELT